MDDRFPVSCGGSFPRLPAPEAAASALANVTGLFSGPDDDVEEVSGEFYDQVTLIDAGENTTRITCPRGGGDISLEWFLDLAEEHGEGIGDRDVAIPCSMRPSRWTLSGTTGLWASRGSRCAP